jgi:hypothetical protein
MTTRELARDEWIAFFNAFSRRYRGQPVTVQRGGTTANEPAQTLAKRLPLVGITADREGDQVTAIEIIVGESPDEHLMHVVRAPSRVRVAQVTDGADELLLIEADDDPTTIVDFSPAGLTEPFAPNGGASGAVEVL